MDPTLTNPLERTADFAPRPQPIEAAKAQARRFYDRYDRIRRFFRILNWGILLGTLAGSLAEIKLVHASLHQRWQLLRASLWPVVSALPHNLKTAWELHPQAVLIGAITLAVLLLAWLFARRWLLATVLSRLLLTLFALTIAYWLYSVIGLGHPTPSLGQLLKTFTRLA